MHSALRSEHGIEIDTQLTDKLESVYRPASFLTSAGHTIATLMGCI